MSIDQNIECSVRFKELKDVNVAVDVVRVFTVQPYRIELQLRANTQLVDGGVRRNLIATASLDALQAYELARTLVEYANSTACMNQMPIDI